MRLYGEEAREDGPHSAAHAVDGDSTHRVVDLQNGVEEVYGDGQSANVMGCGEQRGKTEGYFRGAKVEATMLPIIQVSIVVSKVPVSRRRSWVGTSG